MGRPVLKPEPGYKVQLGTVIRSTLKLHLAAAAAANGRSLSEEVSYRLEQSLHIDEIVARVRAAARGE